MKNNIKRLLKEKGLNQKDLAEGLDVSVREVGHWVAGTRQLTDIWIVKIAKFLKVSPGEIFVDGFPTTTTDTEDHASLVRNIIKLSAQSARAHPKLPISHIVSAVMIVYSGAKEGRLPKSGKRDPEINPEDQKLINFVLKKAESN